MKTKTKKQSKRSPGPADQPIMPLRMANDHPLVLALCEESERVNAIGNRWLNARTPNCQAAEVAMAMGWAFAVTAAWLRVRIARDFRLTHQGKWDPK